MGDLPRPVSWHHQHVLPQIFYVLTPQFLPDCLQDPKEPTMPATDAETPEFLADQGQLLWVKITSNYSLRPDEVRMLVDACREADLVERLEVELRNSPLMVLGSQGQLVASPLVSEVRQHRTVVATLLKSLKLPDSNEGEQQKSRLASDQARSAARARWDRRVAQ